MPQYVSIVLGCLCGTLTVSCADPASTGANTEAMGGTGSTGGSPSIGSTNGTGGSTADAGNTTTGGFTSSSPSVGGNTTAGGFTSSSPSSATQTRKIVRTTSQQSIFTPAELETTVNDLVAELNKANLTSMRLNVIFKTASTYYQPMVIGANRAMSELQVSGGATATQDSSDEATSILEQSSMMTDDIARGTQGIGITPWVDDPGTNINDAVAAGVPVTIDSDLPDSNRDLYIGSVNSQAGITAGNTLKGFLPPGGGTVVILGQGDTSWLDGYNRTMGAKTVLDAAGYTTTVVTSNWSDSGVTDLATLGNLLATSIPPVVGMLGMFSNAWECAAATEAAGKTGNDVASGCIKAGVSGKTNPLLFLGNYSSAHFLGNGCGPISRVVIHDNNLERFFSLFLQTFQTSSQ